MTADSLNMVIIRKRPFKPVFDCEFFRDPFFDLLILECNKYENALPVVDSDLCFPYASTAKIKSREDRGQRRYEKRERQWEERKKLVHAHTQDDKDERWKVEGPVSWKRSCRLLRKTETVKYKRKSIAVICYETELLYYKNKKMK